jgi:hypothetical protein
LRKKNAAGYCVVALPTADKDVMDEAYHQSAKLPVQNSPAHPTTATNRNPQTYIDPRLPEEKYHHDQALKALQQPGPGAPRLPFTNMELVILARTHAHMNFTTGETFVKASTIAREMGHELPNRVWETWKKAASFNLLTEPYAKPNEPAYKKFRRWKMPLQWRPPGQCAGPPDSGAPSSSGAPDHPIRVRDTTQNGCAHNNDRSPQLSLFNEQQRSAHPTPEKTGIPERSSLSFQDGGNERSEPSNLNKPTKEPALTAIAEPLASAVNELAAAIDPLKSELERRGVAADDAARLVKEWPSDSISRQLENFDRQRAKRQIENPGGWFQAALSRKFSTSTVAVAVSPARLPYDFVNKQNAKTTVECDHIRHSIVQTQQLLFEMSADQREQLLQRAIEADAHNFLNAYLKSRQSLRAIIERVKAEGGNLFTHVRIVEAIGEVMNASKNASSEEHGNAIVRRSKSE